MISNQGEGIILQQARSFYEPGRTPTLIKMKKQHGDKEGMVIGIAEDKSVSLKLPDGTVVVVAPDNVQIRLPPVGTIVSFSYDTQARRDTTVSPNIFRVSTDLDWDDVVSNFRQDPMSLSETSQIDGLPAQPVSQWTATSMRKFMEEFAKLRSLDPLRAATWYSLYIPFVRSKGGKLISRKFKGGYFRALQYLFPDISFDHLELQRSIWSEVKNRRDFFVSYAKRHGFDPLEAENWYIQSRDKLLEYKGTRGVIFYHNQSISRALVDLFPDIGLNKSKFRVHQSWRDASVRRAFFEKIAEDNGFDPRNPDNWYRFKNRQMISQLKGGGGILSYYKKSVIRALLDLFPDIGLSKERLQPVIKPVTQSRWRDEDKRRNFFEVYAVQHNFDPLDPQGWYRQSKENITSTKGIRKVLYHHRGSITRALMNLFPNIGLNAALLFKDG